MSETVTVLCVGDVFGEPGRKALHAILPRLRKQHGVDFTIVNVENAAAGAGVTPNIARSILDLGVDVMTSGNHIWDKKEIIEYIGKENLLLRPANFPPGTPGVGSIVAKAGPHRVGVLNLMGRVFLPNLDCPFRTADEELTRLGAEAQVVVVDFHCEATSESQAMGWYLDGRVSAVVGTHRHVQTADERLLPKGTAYITDIGMTGPVDSVIGVDPALALSRFLTQMPNRFEPAKGPAALHGVVIRIEADGGRALSIERIRVPHSA
jgi:2',3'-cyclic-nucleotide 2'-phosphodiesterase